MRLIALGIAIMLFAVVLALSVPLAQLAVLVIGIVGLMVAIFGFFMKCA